MIGPPLPVIAWTSSVQIGMAGNALGKVNVIVGPEPNDADPALMVNWQLCDHPEKFTTDAELPHPVPTVTLVEAQLVPTLPKNIFARTPPSPTPLLVNTQLPVSSA